MQGLQQNAPQTGGAELELSITETKGSCVNSGMFVPTISENADCFFLPILAKSAEDERDPSFRLRLQRISSPAFVDNYLRQHNILLPHNCFQIHCYTYSNIENEW